MEITEYKFTVYITTYLPSRVVRFRPKLDQIGTTLNNHYDFFTFSVHFGSVKPVCQCMEWIKPGKTVVFTSSVNTEHVGLLFCLQLSSRHFTHAQPGSAQTWIIWPWPSTFNVPWTVNSLVVVPITYDQYQSIYNLNNVYW